MKEYWKSLFDTFVRLEWEEEKLSYSCPKRDKLISIGKRLKKDMLNAYQNANDEQIKDLKDILVDPNGDFREKIFVSFVLKFAIEGREELTEDFFMLLIEASLAETNPSVNRVYVEPCVMAFGRKRTKDEFKSRKKLFGDKNLKLQIRSALYWTGSNVEEVSEIKETENNDK